MKYKILAVLLVLAGISALVACPSIPIKPIEEMSDSDFEMLKMATSLVTKIAVRAPIQSDKLSISEAIAIADTIDVVVENPLLIVGSNFLTQELKKAGVTNADALDALALVELFILSKVPAANLAMPLTPRTQALVMAVASGIRAATYSPATVDEQIAAEAELKRIKQ